MSQKVVNEMTIAIVLDNSGYLVYYVAKLQNI